MAEWSKDQIIARIRGEADRQKVDPDLAVAVATQESELWPDAKGDGGKALGLFQLHPGAAIDVGVNPQWRHEPDVNIYGGVAYLKQKLTQAKGNVDEALRRYNGGGDPNYVQNVRRFFKPGVAEAADRPQAGTYTDADVQNALKALQGTQEPSQPQGGTYGEEDVQNALRALQGVPEGAAQPSSPTATSIPEQDAAYRASRGTQALPPVSQTAPTPQTSPRPQEAPQTPDTSWTPGMRFQALPSITQLEPADRAQKTKLFESLNPQMQQEFLRSEEPQAASLAVGGGGAATPQPVTDPAALLALGGRPPQVSTAPTRAPARDPEERLTRIRAEAQQFEQQYGRPWREGDPPLPSQVSLGVPDEKPVTEGWTKPSTLIPLIMGMGIPGLTVAAPGMSAAQAGLSKVLPKAGPLLTRGARAIGEGLSQTAGWTAGRTAETGEVPSAGEIGTEAALNVGTGSLIEGLGAGRQALLRRSQAGRAFQQEGKAAIPEAYTQAVEGQRQAIQTVRAVPGRYAPETPSWTMYERFNDVAKNQEVDLLTAKTALADVRAGRGVLPDGSLRPFPQSVEKIAASLDDAADTASVQTIQQELRRLGPLTRHADGNIRGPAKQLYGIYADALESSPAANDLLRQANATFRKEMALQDVQEWLRPGHGVIRIDNQGREVINPGQLMTRLEKKLGDDTLFARSFSQEELQSLRTDIGSIAGTPTMPRGGPPAGPTAKEILGKQPPWKGHTTTLGAMALVMNQLGVPTEITTALTAAGAVHLVQKQSRWLLANALLNPKRRALMEAAIDGRGGLNPRLYGFLIATLSPEEKQAYERETKAKGR